MVLNGGTLTLEGYHQHLADMVLNGGVIDTRDHAVHDSNLLKFAPEHTPALVGPFDRPKKEFGPGVEPVGLSTRLFAVLYFKSSRFTWMRRWPNMSTAAWLCSSTVYPSSGS